MSYLGYKIAKLIVLSLIVGIWQFWRGLNGLPYRTDQDHLYKREPKRKR